MDKKNGSNERQREAKGRVDCRRTVRFLLLPPSILPIPTPEGPLALSITFIFFGSEQAKSPDSLTLYSLLLIPLVLNPAGLEVFTYSAISVCLQVFQPNIVILLVLTLPSLPLKMELPLYTILER